MHDAYSDRESFAVAQQEAAITDVKSAAGVLRIVRKSMARRICYRNDIAGPERGCHLPEVSP